MATIVLFQRVVQDSPEFGSTETRSVSRVFFDLEVDGEMHHDLTVDVIEPVGGTHQDDEITVKKLQEVAEADQAAFERAVRRYYQGLVTSAGFGKHLAKDKGLRTQGDKLSMGQVVEL